MRAAISGIGVWLPPRVRTNDEYPAAFTDAARNRFQSALVDLKASDETEADRVASRYAAAEHGDPFLASVRRHIADDSLRSWEAEIYAARAALEDAGVEAKDLGAVLVYSLSLDRVQPTGAHKVAHDIGARDAWALGVEAGCASGILPLELARALVESGRYRHVLLVQSNLMTRMVPFMHPVSPTVGDAATGIVVSASERPGILSVSAVSHGDHYDSICFVRGGDDATDTPWYREGGPFVLGSRAPEPMRNLIRQTVAFGVDTVRSAAVEAGIETREIDVLCATQPRRFVPYAIGELLGLDHDRVCITFDEYAHMGACSAVVNLHAARQSGRVRPGSTVALYSQGAGFTRSAAILRWKPDEA